MRRTSLFFFLLIAFLFCNQIAFGQNSKTLVKKTAAYTDAVKNLKLAQQSLGPIELNITAQEDTIDINSFAGQQGLVILINFLEASNQYELAKKEAVKTIDCFKKHKLNARQKRILENCQLIIKAGEIYVPTTLQRMAIKYILSKKLLTPSNEYKAINF